MSHLQKSSSLTTTLVIDWGNNTSEDPDVIDHLLEAEDDIVVAAQRQYHSRDEAFGDEITFTLTVFTSNPQQEYIVEEVGTASWEYALSNHLAVGDVEVTIRGARMVL